MYDWSGTEGHRLCSPPLPPPLSSVFNTSVLVQGNYLRTSSHLQPDTLNNPLISSKWMAIKIFLTLTASPRGIFYLAFLVELGRLKHFQTADREEKLW